MQLSLEPPFITITTTTTTTTTVTIAIAIVIVIATEITTIILSFM